MFFDNANINIYHLLGNLERLRGGIRWMSQIILRWSLVAEDSFRDDRY